MTNPPASCFPNVDKSVVQGTPKLNKSQILLAFDNKFSGLGSGVLQRRLRGFIAGEGSLDTNFLAAANQSNFISHQFTDLGWCINGLDLAESIH